jgi:hypothetical protein
MRIRHILYKRALHQIAVTALAMEYGMGIYRLLNNAS